AVNVGSGGKTSCRAFGLLGRDVAWGSKGLQRSREIAVFTHPLCETKVAHHRLAVSIKEDVSRLKIAMEYSFVMGVSDSARDLSHQPHTLARLDPKCRCCGTEASTRRVFHAEKRQALLTFADFVNRKNVRMIETSDRCRFASKAHERLVRIHLMSENAFHRDDATGVLLSRPINYSHSATPDFLQDFIMTEAPVVIGYVVFCEDPFERFTGHLAFGFKSRAQETIDAGPVIKLGYRAALRTWRRILDYTRDGCRGADCVVHQAALDSAAHKCRISSSTSAGFSTV